MKKLYVLVFIAIKGTLFHNKQISGFDLNNWLLKVHGASVTIELRLRMSNFLILFI